MDRSSAAMWVTARLKWRCAAFKGISDGKQVAVLAPDDVLCFQHFETFKERFSAFP
jgi:transcription-repair coupling factor (superfamily II helicase)